MDWSGMQILAIADDTTGALEVGAQFASAGVRTRVSLRCGLNRSSRVLVVDAHTRRLKPAQARYRIRRLAAAARASGIPCLYKKTDSTLRGNIAAELQALLDVFPERLLIYAPAYPRMGRLVVGGELFVDGVPRGSIPALLARGCGAPVLLAAGAAELEALLDSAAPGSILFCDGRSEEDLRAAAAVLARSGRASIVAGPAGFSGYWIRTLPVERGSVASQPAVRRCLVLSGSMDPVSMEQVRRAAQDGLPTVFVPQDEAADSRAAAEVASRLAAGGCAALATPGVCPRGVSQRIGAMAGRVLEDQTVDGIVVFGGQTAWALLQTLDVTEIEPRFDLLPGTPLSLIRRRGRDIVLVTKAGGFGGTDALLSIRKRLEDNP
jgi:uncharacterized protein YgbK (DUF1537 family)